jgi:excisionase family DNA binding protein
MPDPDNVDTVETFDDYLTVNEIAKTLKLNPQTVRNWIDRGELRAVRVGSRRVRVLRADLDAYPAQGRIDTPPPESDDDSTSVDATLEDRIGDLQDQIRGLRARVETLERDRSR